MTAVAIPYKTSPTWTVDRLNTQGVLKYKITGTNDDTEAYNALVAVAPTSVTIAGMTLSRIVYSLDAVDEGQYEAEVTYSRRQVETGESSYQFETSGGSVHIDRAIATSQTAIAGAGTPPNFNNLIGVNGDEIAGCDIVVPTFSFSENHTLTSGTVDAAYKLALFNATGKVNNDTFKGFAAGEVLFLGASGSQQNGEDWDINFRFLASANQTGLTIGGIGGIDKKGHEYLWVHFVNEDSEDRLVKAIDAVIVNQVYETHDMSNLGIGT